jgi:transposase
VGLATVSDYLARAERAVSDGRCRRAGANRNWKPLFGAEAMFRTPERATPDFAAIHQQHRAQCSVTLQLLWEEYREANPEGYRYSRFCELYRQYKTGEKLFVDWAGPTIPIYKPTGGPTQQAHLFVAVLGASSYTYAKPPATSR